MLIDRYARIAMKVDLIMASRPDRCSRRPFQMGKLSATFSTNGCRAAFDSLEVDKGILRYLIRKASEHRIRMS
jgi:hypothetical protein